MLIFLRIVKSYIAMVGSSLFVIHFHINILYLFQYQLMVYNLKLKTIHLYIIYIIVNSYTKFFLSWDLTLFHIDGQIHTMQ
jgi:hypothetical protein